MYKRKKREDSEARIVILLQIAYEYECTFFALSGTPWSKDRSDLAGALSVLRLGYESD